MIYIVLMTSVKHGIEIDVSAYPPAVIAGLQKTHPDTVSHDGLLIGRAALPQDVLAQDLEFWQANPDIPVENVGSRLETYRPNNASQERLLNAAKFLAKADSKTNFMGLMAFGQAGVGKTHISIGLAKQAMALGANVRYVHVPSESSYPNIDLLTDADLIIMDDANNPYETVTRTIAPIITRFHQRGYGRLFVTSNYDKPNDFLPSMVSDAAEKERIGDRAGAALRLLRVEGKSYRSNISHDPWAGFDENA
jgi:hypothetical protein